MSDTTSEIIPKTLAKKSSRYLPTLVILMLVAGLMGGVFGFSFGKKSLEGVNPTPSGSKSPKSKPKNSTPRSALPETQSELFG